MLNLKPELLWKHFEKLSAIRAEAPTKRPPGPMSLPWPRPNGHPYKQDKVGNVIVTLPATRARARAHRDPAGALGHGLRKKTRTSSMIS